MSKKEIFVMALALGLVLSTSAFAGCGTCEAEGSHTHEGEAKEAVAAVVGVSGEQAAAAVDAYIAANGEDGVLVLGEQKLKLVKMLDKVCKVDDHPCTCGEFTNEAGDTVTVLFDLSGEGDAVAVTGAKVAPDELKCAPADKAVCPVTGKKVDDAKVDVKGAVAKKMEGSHEGSHK